MHSGDITSPVSGSSQPAQCLILDYENEILAGMSDGTTLSQFFLTKTKMNCVVALDKKLHASSFRKGVQEPVPLRQEAVLIP